MHSKIIGGGFLGLALLMFLLALVLAVVLHTELQTPGMQFLQPQTYITSAHFHGLFMMFGVVFPSLLGFAIFYLPGLLGRENIMLAKTSYVLFVFYLIAVSAMFMGLLAALESAHSYKDYIFQPELTREFAYKSTQAGTWLASIVLLLALLNLTLTILFKRDQQIQLMQMPTFVWSVLMVCLASVLPLLMYCINETGQLIDLIWGIGSMADKSQFVLFSTPWYLSHFALLWLLVYLAGFNTQVANMVTVVKQSARWSTLLLLLLVICVIPASGLELYIQQQSQAGALAVEANFYQLNTILLIVAGIIYLASSITLSMILIRGKLRLGPHIFFTLFGVVLFIFGGAQGAMLASAPADFQFHDTWFVDGHAHFMLFGGVIITLFGGAYALLAQWKKSLLADILGYCHCAFSVVISVLLFVIYGLIGLEGMPRNIPDYNPIFAGYNIIAANLAYLLVFVQLLFVFALVATIFGKRRKQNANL